MRKFPSVWLLALLALAAALPRTVWADGGGAPGPGDVAVDANSDALSQAGGTTMTAGQIQDQLGALGDRLAEIQAHLEDVQQPTRDLLDLIKGKRYGGMSDPAISGDEDILYKDAAGFGAALKNGAVFFTKLNIDVIETLPDNSVIHLDFGPAWSPGQYIQPWNVDDPDEEHVGLGTATRLGTLMSTFNASVTSGKFTVTAGNQSFSLSPFSVSGQLSQLPYLFDMNVYRDSSTSKSYYDSQFLTGVPLRDPTESTHPIMGVTTNYNFTPDLSLFDFVGNFQNYYTNSTQPHEFGGMLELNKKDTWGGDYKVIGYNHSNDTGEIISAYGSPLGYFGLMNNTVASFAGEQKLGPTLADFELANSRFDDDSGSNLALANGVAWGGVHVDGQAWRFDTVTRIGGQKFLLGVYGMAPDYLVTDPQGYYNNADANLPRYRPNPLDPGQIIAETVVADPTLAMNDTVTYHVGTQLQFGSSFLMLNLQNSVQQQASDSQIWASHYEGGSNLGEGGWFVFFNNDYQSWLPPDAYKYGSANASNPTPSTANGGLTGTGVNPYLERQFDYNQLVSGPTPAFPTTELLNNYNNTYAPTNNPTQASDAAAPGAIRDVNNQYLYNSYHDLETDDLWRMNMEGIVNSTPQGQALAPSIKDISVATADFRSNLGDYLPLEGRELFWQLYGEMLTVNDSALVAPSMDPNNLFVQTVLDSTLVYNLTDTVNLLLNMGLEDWATNRIATSFVNQDGQTQNATLAYFDREAGVGMDWNFIPNKLNLYLRVKLLNHYDAFANQNNFHEIQMWWQARTFF